MDMRFYCICDRSIEQKQFQTHWKCRKHNLGYYKAKNHPYKHHRTVLPLYVANEATKLK